MHQAIDVLDFWWDVHNQLPQVFIAKYSPFSAAELFDWTLTDTGLLGFAVGNDGDPTGTAAEILEGVVMPNGTWEIKSVAYGGSGTNSTFLGAAEGNGVDVAVGSLANNALIEWSLGNGIWQSASSIPDEVSHRQIDTVIFAFDRFLAIAHEENLTAHLIQSFDGNTWSYFDQWPFSSDESSVGISIAWQAGDLFIQNRGSDRALYRCNSDIIFSAPQGGGFD
jgi:hypothetical protein